jgi:hypothetical protein
MLISLVRGRTSYTAHNRLNYICERLLSNWLGKVVIHACGDAPFAITF